VKFLMRSRFADGGALAIRCSPVIGVVVALVADRCARYRPIIRCV